MVDWFITSLCNDKCAFCFAPFNYLSEVPTLELYLNICDHISKLGFTRITLCGGEPTLVPELIQIIDRLNKLGIEIVFYTNGINVGKIKSIADKLALLSLPLEYPRLNQLEWFRSKKSQEGTFQCLEYFEFKKPSNLKIKIGTVVNRHNIEVIEELYEVIRGYKSIDIWRLYQFSPAGRGLINQNQYTVSDEEFDHLKLRLEKKHFEKPILSFRTRKKAYGYCIDLDPVGRFFRFEGEYIPTNIDIFNSDINAINKAYDLNLHVQGKNWSR